MENVQHEFLPALRTADPADDFETASITKEDSRLDKEANDGTQVIEDFYAKSRQWVEMMHEAYNIPTFYSKTPLRQLLHAQQPEQTQAVAAIHATVKALYDHALENWAAAHRQYTLRQDYPSMLDYTFKELKACLDENDSDFQKCARKDSEASEDEKRLMDINHSESLTVKVYIPTAERYIASKKVTSTGHREG